MREPSLFNRDSHVIQREKKQQYFCSRNLTITPSFLIPYQITGILLQNRTLKLSAFVYDSLQERKNLTSSTYPEDFWKLLKPYTG